MMDYRVHRTIKILSYEDQENWSKIFRNKGDISKEFSSSAALLITNATATAVDIKQAICNWFILWYHVATLTLMQTGFAHHYNNGRLRV